MTECLNRTLWLPDRDKAFK